jgi:cation-transporting P-type ATPase I
VRLVPRPVTSLLERVTGRARRVWATEGRAHLEYRNPDPADLAAFLQRLVADLRALDDVRSVVVNPFVDRVIVSYHDLWVTPEELVAVVEAVEGEFGLLDREFPRDRPDHPGDIEPVQQELLQLASTIMGLGTTVIGRLRIRRQATWPSDLSWLLTLLDNVPQLRHRVEDTLGERGADLVLGVTNSLVRGISLGMTGHLVDVAQRAVRLRQLTTVRAAWAEREPQLQQVPEAVQHARPERVCPLPAGPVESYADEAWSVSLGGFAASMVATDDLERAAASLLDGIPKAARLGRAAFCSQLSRVLAERGILTLDHDALCVLDRVDTVVVDGALLTAVRAEGRPAEVRRFLQGLEKPDLHVIVSGDVDRLPRHVEAVDDRDLVERLQDLQLEDHVVLAVGLTGTPAFAYADVRVGLQPAGSPPPWDADVLCSHELADALLLVRAVGVARRNSEQSSTLAATGAGIGAATGLGGLRRTTGRQVLQVVDSASMLAMGNGIRLASGLAALPHTLHREDVDWHALTPGEVLARVGSRAEGLTDDEWERRYEPPAPDPNLVQRTLHAMGAELANPLTPILAGGAAVSMATGSVTDASLVGGVVGLNAAIGAAQRLKADRALEELSAAGAQTVRVRRGGGTERIAAAELVVGDVIELGTGEPVPADARLLEARSLEVDESSLTGESLPVGKDTTPTDDVAVADRTSMLFQGTTVAAGEALAVVVATGSETEARRALAWSAAESSPTTGVEARLEQLTKLTIPLALLSGAGVAVAGMLRHTPTRQLVDASLGLAVAAVPEGLPLLANAAQRAAARRLSQHRVLVRDPRAIEALGRVDLLCADKTGTLTQGRLRLTVVSDGDVAADLDESADTHERVLLAARRATPIDPSVPRLPHPTDQAVAAGTEEAGVRRADGGDFDVVDDLPFEPGRSYHAVLAATEEGCWLSVKGAPEEILDRCTRRLNGDDAPLTDADRATLTDHAEELAARGLRVLAVAERPFEGEEVGDEDVHDLGFVGFLGLRDPVRPVSAASIERLRQAGIDTIMITGDHPTTARSIAAELGLADGLLFTGPDLDDLDDDELAEVLPKVTVFARVTPLHKVRIVQTAQRLGRVVAMTGDGANDAPAIQLAEVGIAVGSRATQAAREAADVIIMDDRLEVIVDAIAEGRGLWGSVREAVAVLVGGNLGEITYTLLGSIVGRRPPLNTRQLLLVNLLTDVAPAMALAIRTPHASVEQLLAEGPERSLGSELNEALIWRGAGAAVGATTTYVLTRPTGSPARAQTAGLVALVGAQLGQTIVKSGGDPRVIATGVGSFALLGAAIQIPGISRLVGSRPMGPVGWTTGMTGAAIGTVVGLLGPNVEHRFVRDGEPGPSSRIVERLAELAPRIPGILDPGDASPALPPPSGLAGEDELDPDELTPAT